MLAPGQMDEGGLIGQALQVEGDAHAERRRTSKVRIELHFSPSSFAAFSLRINGRTSGLIGSFSNSASQRSGRITGLSLPNSTRSFSSVLAYWTSLGSKYLGDQPDKSI